MKSPNPQSLWEKATNLLHLRVDDNSLAMEGVKDLVKEILHSGKGSIIIRDGVTLEGAVDRLPSKLGKSSKIAILIFYNPIHPILLSDLSAITHFISKCGPQTIIHWTTISSDFIIEKRFILAIISEHNRYFN